MTDDTFTVRVPGHESTTIAQRPDLPPAVGKITDLKISAPDDPSERYRAAKGTHRLCKRCQLIQTANRDQICDSCAEKEPYREFYPDSNQRRTVEYIRWAGEHRTLAVRPIDSENAIEVPYLSWARGEDDRLSLTLDGRLGLDLPKITEFEEDALIEFIANAIAIGAGYPSIYYTKRRMPFR